MRQTMLVNYNVPVRSYKGKLPMSREQLEKYLKDRNF